MRGEVGRVKCKTAVLHWRFGTFLGGLFVFLRGFVASWKWGPLGFLPNSTTAHELSTHAPPTFSHQAQIQRIRKGGRAMTFHWGIRGATEVAFPNSSQIGQLFNSFHARGSPCSLAPPGFPQNEDRNPFRSSALPLLGRGQKPKHRIRR